MHTLEPFYNWRNYYISSEDELSPFFGREYSEFEFSNTIYNYYIHPQWDDIGSETLFIKILYVDYDDKYCIIELFGEWNDAINNDIMILKRDIIDTLLGNGIDKFILIGENVLNFHFGDESYYEEWFEEVEDGWIAFINLRKHVLSEMVKANIDNYFLMSGELNEIGWRTYTPLQLFDKVNALVKKRLD